MINTGEKLFLESLSPIEIQDNNGYDIMHRLLCWAKDTGRDNVYL